MVLLFVVISGGKVKILSSPSDYFQHLLVRWVPPVWR